MKNPKKANMWLFDLSFNLSSIIMTYPLKGSLEGCEKRTLKTGIKYFNNMLNGLGYSEKIKENGIGISQDLELLLGYRELESRLPSLDRDKKIYLKNILNFLQLLSEGKEIEKLELEKYSTFFMELGQNARRSSYFPESSHRL